MPNMLIKCVYGTQWRAYVTNSPIEYTFAGDTVEDQLQSVKILSDAMQQGQGAVVQQVQAVFQNVASGDEQLVVDQLYMDSTELYFDSELIFASDAGSTLLLDIVEAGAELAAVIA